MQNRTGNAGANSREVSRSEAMAAYDKLPRYIRRLIAEAPYNWNSIQLLKLYRDEGGPAVVARLQKNNAHRMKHNYDELKGEKH